MSRHLVLAILNQEHEEFEQAATKARQRVEKLKEMRREPRPEEEAPGAIPQRVALARELDQAEREVIVADAMLLTVQRLTKTIFGALEEPESDPDRELDQAVARRRP